ncbi:MAG: HD-GYP domain-containing protein [Deltaproteobacteria bacterium]|nr:HD-GYP domain-containing protein [Deltaproteobacteria bacterium]
MSDIEIEKIDSILKALNSAIKGKKLYPVGHPAIAAPMTKAYQALSELFKTHAKIFVGIVKDVLVFEETPLMEAEKNLGELIYQIKQKEIEGIIFEKGLIQKEFLSFMDILSGEEIVKGVELQNMLASKNILHISIKSLSKRSILEVYNDAVNVVKETMSQIRMGKAPQSGEIIRVVDELTELVLADRNAMIGLTMIKNYDNYLFNHSVNVSILSVALAQSMNHDKASYRIVGIGGLLHDVGKTGVAEDIIRKPAGLSAHEWETVKQHPVLGSKIVERMEGMAELVGRIIYEHHIRYDHTGYPRTEMPLHPLSMIITVADAYDALTTLRVYQRSYHPVEAIKIMNSLSGRHFDPNTLKAFIAMIGFYPVGTVVRLSTNAIGVVTKVNPAKSTTPFVKIIFGEGGQQLDKPYEIDLSAEGGRASTIVASLDPLTKGLDIGQFFEKEAKDLVPLSA